VRVRVTPRSSRSGVDGVRDDGAVKVRLAAPPVDGAANAELVRVMARALGVPPSAVSIARGTSGRDKLVQVAGIGAAEAAARLAGKEEP